MNLFRVFLFLWTAGIGIQALADLPLSDSDERASIVAALDAELETIRDGDRRLSLRLRDVSIEPYRGSDNLRHYKAEGIAGQFVFTIWGRFDGPEFRVDILKIHRLQLNPVGKRYVKPPHEAIRPIVDAWIKAHFPDDKSSREQLTQEYEWACRLTAKNRQATRARIGDNTYLLGINGHEFSFAIHYGSLAVANDSDAMLAVPQ